MQQDEINSPKHYATHESGVEAIDICECLGFNVGCAFKYLFRRELKHESPVTDLKKALWYIRRELENYGGGPTPSALSEPQRGEFDDRFWRECGEDESVVTDTRKVLVYETSYPAGAMAYMVRGYLVVSSADLAVAAYFIEREIEKHVH